MQLIDTHVHIKFDAYDEDREEMMARAMDAGVSKMLHSCCNTSEISRLIDLTQEYDGSPGKPDLYTGIGVHPIEVGTWHEGTAQEIEDTLITELAKEKAGSYKNKIRAIGECGLDYYHHTEEADQAKQREVFRTQIAIAQKYNLPIIVHSRDAWEDTLAIIEDCYPVDTDGTSRSRRN